MMEVSMKTTRKHPTLYKILAGVLMAAIALTLILIVQINQFEAPLRSLKFNGEPVSYQSATVAYPVLGGLFTLHQDIEGKAFSTVSDRIENVLEVSEHSTLTLIAPDQSQAVFTGPQNLSFETNGIYTLRIEEPLDGSVFHYELSIKVDAKPSVVLSQLDPLQGGLIIGTLDNIPLNSTIEVMSAFKPSAILQTGHQALFYLPIKYQAEAKAYPLEILINGQSMAYTLNVATYAFREVHFTVATSVVSSTVGNQDAVIQYREVIYPTYESAVDSVYWKGAFILPVDQAKETSTFGEKRFVNQSKTPTRHSGIDYGGVPCGTEVKASNAGQVEVSMFLTMIGNTVVIDHGLGLKTYYEHMQDLSVKAGDVVQQGQVIGHVGTTGYSTGCHLHFQAMVKNQSINPAVLYQLD